MKKIGTPYMNTLTLCLKKMITNGYTEGFEMTDQGLFSLNTKRYYTPYQVKIINQFQFEEFSESTEKSILYIIETNDGTKGTLVDPGMKSNYFMKRTDDLKGKNL